MSDRRDARSASPPRPPAAPDSAAPPAPHPAVRRLSLYLRQLETFAALGRDTISSRDLGRALGLGDAQVRKDLAAFGSFGQPGVGYRTDELTARLRAILGTDRTWPVLLVGAGNIGRALSAYRRFADKGFHLAGVVDSDPSAAGRTIGQNGLRVEPMDHLAPVVRRTNARLAVLAIPADVAQRVADELVALGIRGILNFAPTRLRVPAGVSVISVDLAAQLEQLAFQVNLQSGTTDRAPPRDDA